MFPELLRLALVVGVAISRLLADAGYDSADNRWLCLREGIQPVIRHIRGANMAPGSEPSAPSWRMPTPGCSITSASIAATIALPLSFNLYSQPLAFWSLPIGSPIYDNRLLVVHPATRLKLSASALLRSYANLLGSRTHDSSAAGLE